jgi:hypothetical protein
VYQEIPESSTQSLPPVKSLLLTLLALFMAEWYVRQD